MVVFATFTYFARLFLPPELLSRDSGPSGIGVVVLTAAAWLPYLISWSFSRELLPGTGCGVTAFIVFAGLVTIAVAGLNLNFFALHMHISPWVLSFCVSFAMASAAGFCSVIWRPVE
jgi:hypothetical protein